MPEDLSARVVLQEKVRFVGEGSGGQSVVIDYPAPLGDGRGVRGGLELLLMSLAACVGQTVVAILGRMRVTIRGCEVEARGVRRDEHPTVLTDIHLSLVFRGEATDRTAIERALVMAETTYCPVWAMLKEGTRITTAVHIESQ